MKKLPAAPEKLQKIAGHRELLVAGCLVAFLATRALADSTSVVFETGPTWKVASTAPQAGWNTALTFDDSGWQDGTILGYEPFPGVPAIWDDTGLMGGTQVIWVRKVIMIDHALLSASLDVGADDDLQLYVNGAQIIDDHDGIANVWSGIDLSSYLLPGNNLIAAACTNAQPPNHWFSAKMVLAVDSTLVGVPADGYVATKAKIVPNPVTSRARLEFELDRESDVDAFIYDLAGRRLATLVRERLPVGKHEFLVEPSAWSGLTRSGVVFFTVRISGAAAATGKILLMR